MQPSLIFHGQNPSDLLGVEGLEDSLTVALQKHVPRKERYERAMQASAISPLALANGQEKRNIAAQKPARHRLLSSGSCVQHPPRRITGGTGVRITEKVVGKYERL